MIVCVVRVNEIRKLRSHKLIEDRDTSTRLFRSPEKEPRQVDVEKSRLLQKGKASKWMKRMPLKR